ncbi:SRPBCC family protein [Roseateles oligotrophus]|uniref:SRPBCC family protein n=1 Tax=Roseateles oligotrophus TaxID=1769250 RepID=A0ABT2YCZ9_9BURK|nr:SRPBCC family protein [Roseateles oligotrophus]MCV2367925.1 SRPBCC family protein [Roseateles oligotrophus]
MTCTSQPIWDLLTDLENWPRWWPQVSQARLLHRAPVGEAGTKVALTWRSPLGYGFTIDVLNTRRERGEDGHCEIEGRSSGDLMGQGLWVLDPVRSSVTAGEPRQVDVTYRYEVELGRRWMRWLAPLLRTLFKWSHFAVMEAGAQGMATRLNCRSSRLKHWTVVQG